MLSKKKEALLIKSKTFVDKKVAQAKEKEAKEEETLKEQNEALKIFNEIDTNKNNKYLSIIILILDYKLLKKT